MSIDLSGIWATLQSVVNSIVNFFNGISGAVSQISNVGQGIFSGLTAFGSLIWDGIKSIASAVESFANWLYSGFQAIGNAIVSFGQWLWSALSNIPQALNNIGQWLYNGILWLLNVIYTALKNLWNFIVSVVTTIWNTIVNSIDDFRNSINSWFTNIICSVRQKIKLTLATDLSIYLTWKWGEKAVENMNFKRILGIPAVFVGSFFAGYLLSNLLDVILPTNCGTMTIIPPVKLPQIQLPSFPEFTIPIPTSPPSTGSNLLQNIIDNVPSTSVSITATSPFYVNVVDNVPSTSVSTATGQLVTTTVTDEVPSTSVQTQVSTPSSVSVTIEVPSTLVGFPATVVGSIIDSVADYSVDASSFNLGIAGEKVIKGSITDGASTS